MSSFSDLSHLSLFFFVLWFASNVSRLLWLGLLGELLTGVIFVPILKFVPYTDALTLFGSLGIAMLIVDGIPRTMCAEGFADRFLLLRRTSS